MSRTFTTVVIFLCIWLLPDYASSTKIKSSWKNPSATASSLQFKKVLVMATIRHSFTRKIAEDKAVHIIEAGGRAHAVPSYTIIGDEELGDQELVKSKIEGMGFDGVIFMHYAGAKDQRKYAAQDNSSWGLWYPGWGAVYNATTTNDTTVFIETMFYSLKEDKLIWSGISETKNPKNPAKVVGEIAEETMKILQKEGLIATTKK